MKLQDRITLVHVFILYYYYCICLESCSLTAPQVIALILLMVLFVKLLA